MLVDTHCHLNSHQLYKKYQEVKKAAEENNVKLFIVPGFDLETSKLAIKLAEEFGNVYAAIGFHPTEIKNYGEYEYNWLEKNITHPKVVALGEIGFDFHWDTTTEAEQMESFLKQIAIAKKHNLPLIIHSRDAMQLTYDTIKKHCDGMNGVMHSFSGSYEMAKKFVKIGFYIGLGGPVTFTNAKDPKIVCENIELECLLTETDSPYLSPHPLRGKENEPKNVVLVAEKICDIKNITMSKLEEQVLSNVKKLFRIEV